MDFSKLSSNEKLAVYGSVAALVGGVVGGTLSAFGWLAFLAAVAMLAVIFLPQMSPSTTLPGSKGSLMLICGAIAGVIMVLALLTVIGLLGDYFRVFPVNAIFFLIAVVGGIVMAWAGWQAFQAEGGKFNVGMASPGPSNASAPPPAPPAAPAAPPAAPAAPSEPMRTDEPTAMGGDRTDDQT
jgi:hypothetical protein